MVDRIFIGHIPEIGSVALTGIGICMPVTLIVSAFGQLMGVGDAPKASMTLGLSPCMMVITESFVSIAFNRSLLQCGGDLGVGSMAIFSTVMQIVTLPLQGFSQGAQPITSYNYGVGNWKRVSENFKLLFGTSVIYACLLWGIILFLPKIFISFFTNDAGLIDYSVKMIRVVVSVLMILQCIRHFVRLWQTA